MHDVEHWIRRVRDHDPRVTITRYQDGDTLTWYVLGPKPEHWPADLRRQYVTHVDVIESPDSPVPERRPVVTYLDRDTSSTTSTSTTAESGLPGWVVVVGLVAAIGGLLLVAGRSS